MPETRIPDQDAKEQAMTENNLTRIHWNGKEIILIGTAHISRQSAEQVKEVIERERPDAVCVELDRQRYQAITEGNRWKDMDIFQVIKEKKAALLFANLALSSFQKRMARQFGIRPGQEMIQGIESAKETGARLVLADRDIQTTFSRIWHNVGWKGKSLLLAQVISAIFSRETISEEELEKMKEQDMIQTILQEFADQFPELKKPLVDERDQYLAEKIKTAPGEKIVAVLGAAHLPGVIREIERDHDLGELEEVPVKKRRFHLLGWLLPALIVVLIAATFFLNPSAGVDQTLSWVLWTGSFSAAGAAAAFGHPLTILTAFVAAPLTTLHPLLASGWFAGLVQAFIRRPSVRDFENLAEDIMSVKGFWNNKVTRILLIVILTNIATSVGTFIASVDIVRLFFQNV
jgi:pheromone shutdown-related protein TraB